VRRGRGTTDAETVTEALVMLGITPFFRAFPADAVTIEGWLREEPQALAGFERVLRRSQRAAGFAVAFAIHLQDHDAAVIHEAALLHDFAELLLWAHAPNLAGQVERELATVPGLRSVDAQQHVLGLPLSLLQQALMTRWRLPALLVQLDDDHSAALRQVRTVKLAVRLARHSAIDWHNAALPDDLADIAKLLSLSIEHVTALVHDIDG
jgi:HD-like signal output (HDOD) protein